MKVAAGESVALEGPPGSGKSQTIVNAIANALESGNRVLFVAQKATALDVVYARLQALGLSKFVLPMVGAKSDSDAFYAALAERIDMQSERRPSNESSIRRQLQEHRDTLADYIDLLTTQVAGTQITIHQLYGLCVEHHTPLLNLPIELKTLSLKLSAYSEAFGVQEFRAACRNIEEWSSQFAELGIPNESLWASADLLAIDFDKINQVNAGGTAALQQLDRAVTEADSGVADQVEGLLQLHTLEEIAAVRKLGQYWEAQGHAAWRELAAGVTETHEALREFQARYAELESTCSESRVGVAQALTLAPKSSALERYGELADRLSAELIREIPLSSVVADAEREAEMLGTLAEKHDLMSRLQVELSPEEVIQAADARAQLFTHDWFPDVVEQSSFAEIRDDLKSALEALKAAYSVLERSQPMPPVREVQQALRAIESAGFLARFMKPYKTALAAAAPWVGQDPSTAARQGLVDDLNVLLESAKAWETTALAEHLPSPCVETSNFLRNLQKELNDYTRLLAGMGLNASQASVLLTTPLLAELAEPLRQLEGLPSSWFFIGEQRSETQELLSWLEENKQLLETAESLCRREGLIRVEAIKQLTSATSVAQKAAGPLSDAAQELGFSNLETLAELLPALSNWWRRRQMPPRLLLMPSLPSLTRR